jgi:hypothetical protein
VRSSARSWWFLLVGLTTGSRPTGTPSRAATSSSRVAGAIFLLIERRAAEPIVALELFHNRNYAVTIAATFLASIAFFGAIIFLPRWFQFVRSISPTESGLAILPLLAGVITS